VNLFVVPKFQSAGTFCCSKRRVGSGNPCIQVRVAALTKNVSRHNAAGSATEAGPEDALHVSDGIYRIKTNWRRVRGFGNNQIFMQFGTTKPHGEIIRRREPLYSYET
jgi:hypothetical protein